MKKNSILIAMTLLLPSISGFTLNGLYDIGFGVFSKGMGGAAVAFPQDTLTALSNPANLVPIGNRMDVDIQYIRSHRTYEVKGVQPPWGIFNQKVDLAANKNCMAAEAGIALTFFNNRFSAALLIAPQSGGIGTWKQGNPYNPTGTDIAHTNIVSLSFPPTFGLKLFDNEYIGKHFIGAGVDLTPAYVKLAGYKQALGGPFGFSFSASANQDHVSNNGYDWAFGWAVRVGWLGEIRDWLSLGVSYRTKTYMSRFKKYDGIITPRGKANLPSTLYGGVLLKPFRQTSIAFDFGKIFYDDIKTFHNPAFLPLRKNPHGGKNGAGFSWDSIWVYKVGIAQQLTENITVRTGYNYGDAPQRANELDVANDAAYLPSTTRHHVTFGTSLEWATNIISAAFVWGLKHSIKGPNSENFAVGGDGLLFGGTSKVTTNSYQLEVGFSKTW